MNFFPTYIATGEAFCNRKNELKQVIHDIQNGVPVLLISPRRYGKTSLALKTLNNLKLPYATVDLYKAFSEEDVARFIMNGVGVLLTKLETAPKKLLVLAGDVFSKLNVQILYHGAGLSLSFKNDDKPNIIDALLNSLERLDKLACVRNKKVVLFLDEFQMVGEVNKNHAIEAVLREVAQKSTGLLFIFSGSNRHLMEQIFNDKRRPFYKICDHIKLNRISELDYIPYIEAASMAKWKIKLNKDIIKQILSITERHPYYVNKLCYILWQSEIVPNENIVESTWIALVLENKSLTERELSRLTLVQRRLLLVIATNYKTKNLFAQDFLEHAQLSIGSIQNALKNLLQADYLYKDDEGYYRILDPLLKSTLTN